MTAPPRITIAVPLFRSEPFVDRIAANVAAIDLEDVEIVISDRHGLDGAVALLRKRLALDRRVRFATATDALSWTDHYNLLLREASGVFFIWMPHDDEFPPGYVSKLVARLEAEPDVMLAYGIMEAVDLDGRPVRLVSRIGPRRPEDSWTQRSAGEFLRSNQTAIPFRGVFRREPALRSALWLPRCRGADQSWLFGLNLLGPIRFDPTVVCRKTIHKKSVSQTTPRALRDVLRMAAAMRSFVDAHVQDPDDARALRRAIVFWSMTTAALEAGSIASRRLGVPRIRARFRR